MSRDYRLYLEDMPTSALKVIRYAKGMTLQDFLADERTFDAVVRNLEVIGEAAKHVPDDLRQTYSAVEWRRIAGLRDVLIHGYLGLEDETLWDIVQNEMPALLEHLKVILSSRSAGPDEQIRAEE